MDATACRPGCAITSHELRLLSASGCVLRSGRSREAAELRFEETGLFDGDVYSVEVHGFCAEDQCARCAGAATTSAVDGARLRVAITTTSRCALSSHPPCERTFHWLGSAAAVLAGGMRRGGADAGTLAGPPLFPDGDGVAETATRVVELAVSDDAYVVAGQYANDARGLDPKLVVTTPDRLTEPGDFDYLREALIRVPLGIHDPAATAGAELRLHTTYGTTFPLPHDARFELVAVTVDAWDEKTVTWNKAPASAATLDVAPVIDQGWTSLDATAFVLREQIGDGVASFRIRSDRQGYISAGSRETATPPVLRLHQISGVTANDVATFAFVTSAAGVHYLWARLYYPGRTAYPERDPNRFWVIVDSAAPRLLGGRIDQDRVWHWDGMRGAPLPIGFLEPGRHTLRIVGHTAREAAGKNLSPRLDVILVTNDPTHVPADEEVRL